MEPDTTSPAAGPAVPSADAPSPGGAQANGTSTPAAGGQTDVSRETSDLDSGPSDPEVDAALDALFGTMESGEPAAPESVEGSAGESPATSTGGTNPDEPGRTFYDRASFLLERDALVERVMEKLASPDPVEAEEFKRRIDAEIYVASLETRLSLGELDRFLVSAKGFMGKGGVIGRMARRGKGSTDGEG